jgi:hypothetical protein
MADPDKKSFHVLVVGAGEVSPTANIRVKMFSADFENIGKCWFTCRTGFEERKYISNIQD